MCGILGGSNPKWNYEQGIKAMHHRGPDGEKIVNLDNFTLAFARLAIIDLSEKGMQPMFSQNGEVGIVFNGEIYGYQKLRNKLIEKGYHFRSTTDTEVVLNAYIEWGEKFISRVDGMFGIAIYDKREGTVKLYRDRAGIKPLYYYYDGNDFAFSSELKGIEQACTNVDLKLDNTAIYDYLNYLYIPEPKTCYRDVSKLLPGHMLTYRIATGKIEKKVSYWRLKVNTTQGRMRKEVDLVDELKCLIHESVKEQMVADVPVGTFLSGGVDSSVVTYETNQCNPLTETFSIGFTEKKYDELKYATMLSSKHHIPMNQKIFNRENFEAYYGKLRDWYDEPFADTSAFPTYYLSQYAKQKVTVALTGDGGDEVFGGYPRYSLLKEKKYFANERIAKWVQLCGRIEVLNQLGDVIENVYDILLRTYHYAIEPDKKEIRKALNIPDDYDEYWIMKKYYHKELPAITRGQYLDFKTYLPGDILTKVDRTSMAVSLETRVPLLSRKIVEFAFGLSEEERCPAGELKGLLKKAYVNEIGKTIAYRDKRGFSIPARYISNKKSPQEEILKNVWHI